MSAARITFNSGTSLEVFSGGSGGPGGEFVAIRMAGRVVHYGNRKGTGQINRHGVG